MDNTVSDAVQYRKGAITNSFCTFYVFVAWAVYQHTNGQIQIGQIEVKTIVLGSMSRDKVWRKVHSI